VEGNAHNLDLQGVKDSQGMRFADLKRVLESVSPCGKALHFTIAAKFMNGSYRRKMTVLFCQMMLVLLFLSFDALSGAAAVEMGQPGIPVLVYHRFGDTVGDSMTLTAARFESHLKYLHDNGYRIIPLRQLVQYRLSAEPALPQRAVVITADDGHRSIYTHMLGLAAKYQVPVTLFIYPSAISNADYALTWERLAALKESGLFDIQSHSYWHPNFRQEKRRLRPGEYDKFVRMQLVKSKQVLETKLGGKVDLLAWPFGIFDDELISKAAAAGYVAGFTLEGRHVTPRDPVMALPRYLITQAVDLKVFSNVISGKYVSPSKGY
jgi:peptidoglycan/xylan/chitin deacetylase (PgdA/CDA1 family)